MRVVHVFNMANDGYSTVKGLRRIAVDAELFVSRPEHVASLPQWEDGKADMSRIHDLYDPNWEAFDWQMPSWVHVWGPEHRSVLADSFHGRMSRFSRLAENWVRHIPFAGGVLDFIPRVRDLDDYDLVVGHYPFASMGLIYSMLTQKPYIVVDEGWCRILQENRRGNREARLGYRLASRVMFTNVDTEPLLRRYGYSNVYVPFAIDTNLYSPDASAVDPEPPVFYQPARQYWSEKGNDKLILAFARYLKRNPAARLQLAYWRQEGRKDNSGDAIALIKSLGIERKVEWLPLMCKRDLVKQYQRVTAVFDQFVYGALGTTGMEVMSCRKPLVAYVNPAFWGRYHRSLPPVVNACSVDEIYGAMVALENGGFRAERASAGRKWVMQNCDYTVVANRHLDLYKKVIELR